MNEPRLTDEDRSIWAQWERTCRMWSRSQQHATMVTRARRRIKKMIALQPDAYLAWSAGKDSTVMAYLASTCGVKLAFSVKDDLDFPGEEGYLENLAGLWRLQLDIARPSFSLAEFLRDSGVTAGSDIHSRTSALSKRGFYPLVEQYAESKGHPGVYLGLRAAESRGRKMNAYVRGAIYTKRSGEVICQPLWDWADIDVYACAFANDIELLPLYRCVRFADSPGRVRKSWWVPGASSAHGQGVWLRSYYPSLHRKLLTIIPTASAES